MKNYKHFTLLAIVFALAGCVAQKNYPVFQPTQTIARTPTVIPSPTSASTLPDWCKSIDQENGIPVDSILKKSHILYIALILYKDDQTWKYSIKDNSNEPSSDVFPLYETKGGEDTGYSFSLDSADEKHIAIWGQWYETSDPDGTYSLIIRDKESGQDVDIFHTGPADSIEGGWSPDGKHFAFTLYKNSDENNAHYYSLVYSINADGTGLTPLTEKMSLLLERPRWSPDSKKIAIPVWGSRDGYIMIINFQTGNITYYKVAPIIKFRTTLYGYGWDQHEMAWSPDSQWLAYISQHYEHTGIEILNTENGEIYCIENEKIHSVDRLIWNYDNP